MAEPRRQQRGGWRETFANQLFRLFKVARIHDLENEAARNALEQAAGTFDELLRKRAEHLDIIFAGDNIFVNGRPLHASRETYESLLELGELLNEIGFNEVTLREGVDGSELRSMLENYLALVNNPDEREGSTADVTDSIRFRRIDPKKILELDDQADRTTQEQVLRLYPAAIVTMRRFLEELRRGEMRALRFAKRLAQRFVALSESEAETLMAVLAMKRARDEPAGIAVNSAILSLLMARRLTDDYRILQRVCFTAMVADIGRPRAAGIYESESQPNVIPNLTTEGKERLGPLNALLLLKNARVRVPALRRAVVGYESGWLQNKEVLGWPWGETLRPTVEAFLIEAARRFWDLMALKPSMKERRPPSEVFETMRRRAGTKVEHAMVDLVMETLAYFERGTVVETSTGWKGVVVEAGETIPDFPRPVVRMVRDANGNAVEPQDLDLSSDELDLRRFGLIARRIRGSNDRRLAEVAEGLRPDDWEERRREPSATSRPTNRAVVTRESASSRAPAPSPGSEEAEETGTDADAPAVERDDGLEVDTPAEWNAGAESTTPDSPEAKSVPEGDAENRQPADLDPGPPGGENDDEDTEMVLEFGPGSATPTSKQVKAIPDRDESSNSGPSAAAESTESEEISGADIRGSSPEEIRGGDSDSQRAAEAQTSRSGDLESSGDFQSLEELSASPVESMEESEIEESETEESFAEISDVEPIDPDSAPEETLSGAGSGEDDGAGLEDLAEGLDEATAAQEDRHTRQVESDDADELLGDFVDDAGESSDESFTLDPDDSRLDEMAADLDDDSIESSGPTEAISSEKSQELLEDFVDGAPDPNDSRLDEMAADLDDDSIESSGPTEAISSEKSQELLEDFVEESSNYSEGPSDPEESKLGEMADDLEEGSVESSGATEAISSEKSRELLEDFVEAESEAEVEEGAGDEPGGESAESEASDTESPDGDEDDDSDELLRDYIDGLDPDDS